MKPQREKSEHAKSDRVIWAAYAAGHHLAALDAWQTSAWSLRNLFEQRPGTPIFDLPEWEAELDQIVDALMEADLLRQKEGVYLQRSIGKWRHDVQIMLEDFQNARHGHFFKPHVDWRSAWPRPRRSLQVVGKLIKAALKPDAYLTSWFQLGTLFAEVVLEFSFGGDELHTTESFCRKLRSLDPEGRFRCVGLLIDLLNAEKPRRECPAAYKFFTFPTFGLSLNDVELIFRRSLQALALPIWVVMRPQSVDVFGRIFQEIDFHTAEWLMFRGLCRNPSRLLTSTDLVNVANLKGKRTTVAPHISKLRKKLRPAVEAFFSGMDPPESAAMCFLVCCPQPDGTRCYQLDIPSRHVRFEPDDGAVGEKHAKP